MQRTHQTFSVWIIADLTYERRPGSRLDGRSSNIGRSASAHSVYASGSIGTALGVLSEVHNHIGDEVTDSANAECTLRHRQRLRPAVGGGPFGLVSQIDS